MNKGVSADGMRTHRLGEDGPDVSVLGLGCNTFGLRVGFAETREIVATALERGINFFDTADLYGKTDSERLLGEALGTRRDEVIIATKWGFTTLEGAPQRRSLGLLKREMPRGSEPYMRWALDRSLQRLGTDWIDVYQYHKIDAETPLEETFGTLASFVREGKIRWAGLPALEAGALEEAVVLARRIGLPLVQSSFSTASCVARWNASCYRSASAWESVSSRTFLSKVAFSLASTAVGSRFRRIPALRASRRSGPESGF